MADSGECPFCGNHEHVIGCKMERANRPVTPLPPLGDEEIETLHDLHNAIHFPHDKCTYCLLVWPCPVARLLAERQALLGKSVVDQGLIGGYQTLSHAQAERIDRAHAEIAAVLLGPHTILARGEADEDSNLYASLALTMARITAQLVERDAELARINGINAQMCRNWNANVIDASRWQTRAETAEAALVERDARIAALVTFPAAIGELRLYSMEQANTISELEGKLAEVERAQDALIGYYGDLPK